MNKRLGYWSIEGRRILMVAGTCNDEVENDTTQSRDDDFNDESEVETEDFD